MSIWKKLPYNIQNEILSYFDLMMILHFYENHVRLSDHFIDYYKKNIIITKQQKPVLETLFKFIELDRLIFWIQNDNKNIIEFLYVKMEQKKLMNNLLFFCLLYASEDFLSYILENFNFENIIYLNYKCNDNCYIYGIEILAIKLRNGIMTKGYKYINDTCDLYFDKNIFIKNKILNYRSKSKINIRYFYLIDKLYKEYIEKMNLNKSVVKRGGRKINYYELYIQEL